MEELYLQNHWVNERIVGVIGEEGLEMVQIVVMRHQNHLLSSMVIGAA